MSSGWAEPWPNPVGPGLILVFWPVDRMARVDLRTITRVIEPQDIITRDNVSVRVNAVLYFRIVDPMRSVLEVADFLFATSQVALTTLRSTLGQAELDDLLTEREKVNHRLQEIIDKHTEPWGVKVSVVEVKDVDLPEPMKRCMARQAEAERERRAKVINAQGEFQAADKLRQAAEIMTPYPMAMQMRYLQALADVASDENSTIIFPLPLELLGPFLKGGRDGAAARDDGRPKDAVPVAKDPAQAEKITGVGCRSGNGYGQRPIACSCPTYHKILVNNINQEVRTVPLRTQTKNGANARIAGSDTPRSAAVDQKSLIEGLNHDLAGEFQAILMYIQYSAKLTGPYRRELRALFQAEVTDETETRSVPGGQGRCPWRGTDDQAARSAPSRSAEGNAGASASGRETSDRGLRRAAAPGGFLWGRRPQGEPRKPGRR